VPEEETLSADADRSLASPSKPPRALSEWQVFVAGLHAERAKAFPGTVEDTTLGAAGINASFKALLTEHGKPLIRAAYAAFLADEWARTRDPPCPLQVFVSAKKLPGYLSAGKRRLALNDTAPPREVTQEELYPQPYKLLEAKS
jgi:hypothetical protein